MSALDLIFKQLLGPVSMAFYDWKGAKRQTKDLFLEIVNTSRSKKEIREAIEKL